MIDFKSTAEKKKEEKLADDGVTIPPIPKQKIELLKTSKYLHKVVTTPLNMPCELIVPFGYGDILSQRIRVELTRVKKKLKAAGHQVAEFMLKADVKHDLERNRDILTMTRRAKDGDIDLSDIERMMEEAMGGEKKS